MEDITERLNALEAKIDATYQSAEKTRKYILTMLIVTVITIVLPLIGLVFVVPMVMHTLLSAYTVL